MLQRTTLLGLIYTVITIAFSDALIRNTKIRTNPHDTKTFFMSEEYNSCVTTSDPLKYDIDSAMHETYTELANELIGGHLTEHKQSWIAIAGGPGSGNVNVCIVWFWGWL